MDEVSNYLELAGLNLEISLAYLRDTEDEFSTVIRKLEYCLKLIKELRQYDIFSYHNQYLDSGEYIELHCN